MVVGTVAVFLFRTVLIKQGKSSFMSLISISFNFYFFCLTWSKCFGVLISCTKTKQMFIAFQHECLHWFIYLFPILLPKQQKSVGCIALLENLYVTQNGLAKEHIFFMNWDSELIIQPVWFHSHHCSKSFLLEEESCPIAQELSPWLWSQRNLQLASALGEHCDEMKRLERACFKKVNCAWHFLGNKAKSWFLRKFIIWILYPYWQCLL